jgi:hypothetical protein
MSEDAEIEAYYTGSSVGEFIRITYGDLTQGEFTDLDIREALLLQWQLAGAINDYEKAAGR